MALRTDYFWRHSFLFALALCSSAVQALSPSQVFEAVKDSVVIIKSLDVKGVQTAMGSGVLLPSGKVATNCHVIKDGSRFQVGRGERFVVATIYASDSDKDICLLDSNDIGGKPATLGKAASLKIGEAVYAVGAPQGLELSLSDGIVSQLRGSPPPFIQTTTAISPGSSGGGLFDSEGRLVGLTTLYIDDGQSLNFAMPVEWLADLKPGKKIASKQRSQIDWFTRVVALEKKQDWPGLLAWSTQWAKAEPANSVAWYAIGSAQQKLKQLEPAVAAYRRALHINPEDADAWNNLGFAYAKLRRYDDAISAYLQALRINPEYADAWGKLGLTYSDFGRYDDAISAYRQALRINPEDVDVWSSLGFTYGQLKHYDDSIASYRQALRINPEYVDAWTGLTVAYYASGNTTAALQGVKILRTLDPVRAEKLFNLIVPR